MNLFPNRSHPKVLGVRTSTCELGGDTIQPITPSLFLLWLWDHQTTFWLLGVFPGAQDWAVRVLENICTSLLVTGDECPHCEWSFCSLQSLLWVWLAWISSWEPGHCSCTDSVSFGDYTAVKPNLSKMMDVITKGIDTWVKGGDSQIFGHRQSILSLVHLPRTTGILKSGKLLRARPRTRVNKAVNPGKCPPAFTKLSDKTAKYLLYLGASAKEKKGLDFNFNILACQYPFLASSSVFQVLCP